MKKVWRKRVSLLLTLCMVITMAPAVAWAAEDQATKLDVAKGNVVINSGSISGKDESGMEITDVNPDGYYLMSSTTSTEYTVTINSDCTIYLGGLDILVPKPADKDDYNRPNPININGSHEVTMILVDGKTNTLASAEGKRVGGVYRGSGKAAIRVPAGASLTIEGKSGVLNAVGAQGHNIKDSEAHAGGGAGIGGNGAWATGYQTDAEGSGKITIKGGMINATGGDAKGYWGAGGAGIGGGGGGYQEKGGASEEITIAGGTVTAAAGKGQTVFTPIGAGGSGDSSYGKAETKSIAVNGGYLSLKSKMELLAKSVLSIGKGGQVEFSPGSQVKIADSSLRLPDSGGIIAGGEDGKLTVPIGTKIQKGDGEPYMVSDGGTSIDPYVCHKVTINPDNGTGTTTRDIRHNTVFKASELEKPTKSGYRFLGWEADGAFFSSQIMVTKDIAIIAQWERETYKVTINRGNGSANTEKFYGYEEVLKTSELETPSKSGYKFLGWAVDGKLISDDGIKVTKNIELIAQWKKAHNVTINPDNGSEKAVKIVADGEVLKISELETPTRSGYKFRGWTVDGKDVSDEITVTKDIELIAQWKKKSSDSDSMPGQEYKISADSSTDNGKVELSPSKAQKGDKVTITVTPDKGYVIGKVTGKAANGNKLEIKENGSGEYTFTMPDCQVEVKATFVKAEEKTEEAKSEEEKSKEEKSKEEKPIILTIHQKVANVFGQPVVTDAAPVIRNNRTMLPIRFIAEALGATVAWDSALNKASVTKGDDVLDIYIGSATAFVNGRPVHLDSPAFIESSRTYLPIRFVAENLGATVSWNAETQEITIVPKK